MERKIRGISRRFRRKIRNLINDLKSTVNKLEEQYNDECNQYISTLENYKNEAAKILNIISNTSMAGGYKKADHEGKHVNCGEL